jgi:AcrR family transcriptional regulator
LLIFVAIRWIVSARVAPVVTTAEQKRVQRNLEILQAAKEVFAERGFHAASISDVIKRAGIARGTFYLYFTSKDAVFESILDQAILDLEERIIGVDISEGAAPPAVQLHQNVSRILQYMLSDRALIQIILNHGLPPDSTMAKRVDEFFTKVEERIETSLSYGMRVGLVRECDPALTSAQILGALRGGIRRLTKAQDDIDVKPIASQLIDFTLHGVMVNHPTGSHG